tara:strand:+ start:1003 stop:2160 length:1158 start_codon:yes stop_codon:yes gene_type:complete
MFDKFFDEPKFDFDAERTKFISNLDLLKSMSVQEQTLYKKWQEFNKNEYNMRNKVTNFPKYYNRLWKPTDITDKELTIKEIESIEPEVVFVPSDDASNWTMYRKLIHTMDWNANPGRNQKYFIRDKVTDRILGLVSLGSDVTSIKVRDDYIGWSKDNKFVDHKLNNTAIASTIVCTQPIGFNFLGGKLIAALTTSSTIRDKWYEQYNDILIGVTTTSLYGVHSQYNGIPHWKTLGESAGKIAIKPDDDVYFVWANWLKENYREEFDKAQSQTGPKQNTINRIFKHLGIKGKDYEHGFHRGVFFANMYDNGLEYLRDEIEDKDLRMKPKFENDIDYIMNWWKPKAIRRYVKLYDNDKLKPEVLFYGDIVGKTWEETKEQYIGEVGR